MYIYDDLLDPETLILNYKYNRNDNPHWHEFWNVARARNNYIDMFGNKINADEQYFKFILGGYDNRLSVHSFSLLLKKIDELPYAAKADLEMFLSAVKEEKVWLFDHPISIFSKFFKSLQMH